jgi:hypothetical protein
MLPGTERGRYGRHVRVFGERADRGAHLVGSVPAATSYDAMCSVAGALGDRLERVPDGETGERSDWIAWQYPILAGTPGLEVTAATEHSYRGLPPLTLTRAADGGRAPVSLRGSLGYADAASESYEVFAGLRADGVVPPWCRFQVSLPTPLSPVAAFVAEDAQAAVEPVYEAAMLAEVGTILGAIPHDDLAIQWDANFEFAMLDGSLRAWFSEVSTGVTERLARLGELIPVDVQLGFHFCQDHRRLHHPRPYDATRMVDTAIAVVRSMRRRLDWLHVPAPEARLDVAFFEKLAPLAARPDIALYLGLIHLHEGDAGAGARITAARRYLKHFGIAATCGLGRHVAPELPELLRLHHEACSPVAAAPPPVPRPTMAS